MDMETRIARCADELASAISDAKLLPGKYLMNFDPSPRLSPSDECCAGMGDNHHFPMGTEPLRLGFLGVAQAAAQARGKDALAKANLAAIEKVYTALAGLHERAGLSTGAPNDFFEALQLYFTLWRMRSIFGTASLGRLDQYLYPFYQRSKPPRERALDALCELYEYLNSLASGDTLMTVLLGGSDEHGADETNELSLLMLDAALTVQKSEPHISVRLHPGTRKDFIDKALQLMALGHGQATVYYDQNIIPELTAAGIAPDMACRYVNNGCTEIMPDQQGLIEFENLDAVKILELALFRGQSPALPGEPVGRYWTVNQPEQAWETTCRFGFDSGDAEHAPDYETVEAIY